MRCPFATWRPITANNGPAMRSQLGLVLHVQVGNGSLYDYFNDPASQVSAHFWASKDGQLEQYVDTGIQAWAEVNGNPDYVSIETEGDPSEPLTPVQLEVVARVFVWLHQFNGTPVVGPVAHGQPGLTPHCNPDGTPDVSWGNHTCPGPVRLAQMPQIVQISQPLSNYQEDSMTAVVVNGEIKIYAVGAGVSAGHLLEFTRQPGQQTNDVRDITAEIGAQNSGGLFLVEA